MAPLDSGKGAKNVTPRVGARCSVLGALCLGAGAGLPAVARSAKAGAGARCVYRKRTLRNSLC